ncbi:MAG: DUF927 domain-containing protein [Eubacteriales bacterium]|nr:DUF927 domain-containing protein [Eubacteriales bacterium]
MSSNEEKNNIVYTKEAFYDSTAPFEYVYLFRDDEFTHKREIEKMSDQAKLVGVRNFKTLYKDYCASIAKTKGESISEKTTNFDQQPLELNSGVWRADDYGIRKSNRYDGEDVACVHPIMPVKRLVNIDTGIEKLELAYRKGKSWRKTICDKRQLASASSIIGLADYGVAVTSENAKYLVTYLHDLENLNYEVIPENNSVGRLGWIEGEGFSPYVEDLVFDGDISFKHFFESVRERGSYEKWLAAVREIRKRDIPARILLAASFASVLVEPCGGLPFFVHLHGGTETGKTLGLMLAASVWANPEMGRYIHTFNSTAVAQELSAGFVNSMPLILDELQIIKDKKDFDSMIYQLSEGVGRARGQKAGGIQKTLTWNNCILTTGEQPISNHASGGGAVNRIIEINCEDTKLFDDPTRLAETLKKNYGFAGKEFVQKLQEKGNMETARQLQKDIYKSILKGDTTEKQALAASMILTADALISMWTFEDKQELYYKDLTQYLSTKAEVSQNERAYSWLTDWLAQNKSHFRKNEQDTWGEVNEGTDIYSAKIIRTVFDKHCQEAGFSPQSFLSWLKRNGLMDADGRGLSKRMRVNGVLCQCVVLRFAPEGFYGDH